MATKGVRKRMYAMHLRLEQVIPAGLASAAGFAGIGAGQEPAL